ncbi:MAG TPA: response regulator [Candidatus Omnitrophica bacterium]|nr:response regulator [Candidatus Omnitrophota bacterium]
MGYGLSDKCSNYFVDIWIEEEKKHIIREDSWGDIFHQRRNNYFEEYGDSHDGFVAGNRLNEDKEDKVSSTHILVIDDDRLILKTLKRLLVKEGYKVSIASGGEEALKTIAKETFDLIISDLKMPKMNGIETVEKLRAYLAENDKPLVPEIFISAYAQEDIYREALRLKASDYIEKPFDIKALLQAVKKAIGK